MEMQSAKSRLNLSTKKSLRKETKGKKNTRKKMGAIVSRQKRNNKKSRNARRAPDKAITVWGTLDRKAKISGGGGVIRDALPRTKKNIFVGKR